MQNKVNAERQMKIMINYKFLLFILLFIPLYLFNNVYIKIIGTTCIVLVFIITIFEAIYKMNKIKVNKTWLWFLLFSFHSIIMLLRTPTLQALYSCLLQIALLFFISMFTTSRLDEQAIKKIFKWGRLVYFILLIPAGIIALKGGSSDFGRFSDYYSPVIYKVMLPCTFFFIANSEHKFFKMLIFSFIFLRIGERTSSIVLIFIFIVYLVLKRIKKSKRLYNLVFIGSFVFLIGFIYGYIQLQYTEIGYMINSIFRQYTGGNFFSGRNRIWEIAINYIMKAPTLGYGLDNGILHSAGIELSTHNTFIHILLQGGLVGLLIFFLFMYSIWKSYFNYLDDDIVVTAAAYLIGILIFINFEVTLIGNSAVIAIFLWFILGIGLVKCNDLKKSIK